MQPVLPMVWWHLALRIEITRIEELRPQPSHFKTAAREQNGYFTSTMHTGTNRNMEINILKTNTVFSKVREGMASHIKGENTNKRQDKASVNIILHTEQAQT